jgi:hypothetical protein
LAPVAVPPAVPADDHFFHRLIDRERGRFLTRREFVERLQEVCHDPLRGQRQKVILQEPVVVSVRGDVGALEGIGPQVVELGNAQSRERLGPHTQRPFAALLHEHDFPVVESQRDQVAVIVEVDETWTRTLLLLAGQIRRQIVTVDMHPKHLVARLVAFFQFRHDVGFSGQGKKCGQPVVVLHDFPRNFARRNFSRPAHQQWHAERSFPICVLFAAERRHASVWP